MTSPETVTQLLVDWRSGDNNALEKLTPLVYKSLRDLAERYMQGERHDHTLQPTAVVNEAFSKLIDMQISWQDRTHFYAVAARLMRRILVDHARAHRREKRGGQAINVTFEEFAIPAEAESSDLVDLDESLHRLNDLDERKSNVIELHFFGGLTYDEIAEALSISAATVDRELRFAKAWLYRDLTEQTI